MIHEGQTTMYAWHVTIWSDFLACGYDNPQSRIPCSPRPARMPQYRQYMSKNQCCYMTCTATICHKLRNKTIYVLHFQVFESMLTAVKDQLLRGRSLAVSQTSVQTLFYAA